MTSHHIDNLQDLCPQKSGCTSCAHIRGYLPTDGDRMYNGQHITVVRCRTFCNGERYTGKLLYPRTPTCACSVETDLVDGYPIKQIFINFTEGTKDVRIYSPPGFLQSEERVRLD